MTDANNLRTFMNLMEGLSFEPDNTKIWAWFTDEGEGNFFRGPFNGLEDAQAYADSYPERRHLSDELPINGFIEESGLNELELRFLANELARPNYTADSWVQVCSFGDSYTYQAVRMLDLLPANERPRDHVAKLAKLEATFPAFYNPESLTVDMHSDVYRSDDYDNEETLDLDHEEEDDGPALGAPSN